MGALIVIAIASFIFDTNAADTLAYLWAGIQVTLYITFIAYLFSFFIGLSLALMRLSRWRICRELATFYVELIRGVPVLVILYYLAFVLIPGFIMLANHALGPIISAGWLKGFQIRDFSMTSRAVIALSLAYSAFMSEIFRAGIQSIDKGQYEAAQALGLSRFQILYAIILPQAIRQVLPALVNEFVALIKDSSLVSVLGVADITQLGKLRSASTFKFLETYNIVAFLYLGLTLIFSALSRYLEKYLEKSRS